jgi:hypothetical protein
VGTVNALLNINLGLTKPITLLIEKLSKGAGIIYDPKRLVEMAKAEVEVDKIKAIGNLEVDAIKRQSLDTSNINDKFEKVLANCRLGVRTSRYKNDHACS